MINTQKCRDAAEFLCAAGKLRWDCETKDVMEIIERICFPEPAKVDGDEGVRACYNSLIMGGDKASNSIAIHCPSRNAFKF